MELTTLHSGCFASSWLFMMSKIQNLNGTHNGNPISLKHGVVVYDVKDTKFEWNSQHSKGCPISHIVVYDVKDTKFEWNSQLYESIIILTWGCL